MKRKLMTPIAVFAGCTIWLYAVGLLAGTTVADVVKMENPAYNEHTKAIVQFNRKARKQADTRKPLLPCAFVRDCLEK
jgi:hypothetical protein